MMRPTNMIGVVGLFIGAMSAFGAAHDISERIKRSPTDFLPTGVVVGSAPEWKVEAFAPFVLDETTPLATIDYGTEVGGVPWFNVDSLDEPAQIEVKYSEEWRGLNEVYSDGPFTFANGLMNSYRVETFNLSKPGITSSSQVQGGQRWQSIRLLTKGPVKFQMVGYTASFTVDELDALPGRFESDNEKLNAIWHLGVRGAEASCFGPRTQPAVWRIDPENGALIENQRPSESAVNSPLKNYVLDFQAKIERAGIWWATAWPLAGAGGRVGYVLTGELPEETTFLNHNYTLFPRNSIVFTHLWGPVNQTTLPGYILDTFELPFSVSEGEWLNIQTSMHESGRIAVSINGLSAFNVSISDYRSDVATVGGFGFGTWQDQKAYFRNAVATDIASGQVIYNNTLTGEDTLVEYGTQSNIGGVCLDGPKRDRLVWLGDYYHTSRIIGVSTSRYDIYKGTFDFILDSQVANGMLSIETAMGYVTDPAVLAPSGSYGFAADYNLLGLLSFYYYVRDSNDVQFARDNWGRWQNTIEWAVRNINATDGLAYVGSAFLGGNRGGAAFSCLTAQSIKAMAEIATAVGDAESADRYTEIAQTLSDNIQSKLWNEDRGFFGVQANDKSAFSVAGSAFCIKAGVATPAQQKRLTESIDELALSPGFKDHSYIVDTDPATKISPNTNGFLLDALFLVGAYDKAAELMDSLWTPMIADPRTSTGASWEYVGLDGTPGLGLFTSLGHTWGGGATYALTEYVAGLRAGQGPAAFGYRRWVVDPSAGLQMGLRRASARIMTAFGGAVSVSWEVNAPGDTLSVSIQAPGETSGIFQLGDIRKRLCGKEKYSFEVEL